MKTKRYRIKMTFTEPMLGAIALDPAAFSDNASGANAPNIDALEDEIEHLPAESTKGKTGFFRADDGSLFEYDYVFKGFFKGACGMLRRVPGSLSSKVTSYKKFIDGLVFTYPRQVRIYLPEGSPAELEVFTRALRAQTAQGERVALASSEVCPIGSWVEFEVETLVDCEALLSEWLDYGSKWGLRQWRNAGYGRFTYTMEEIKPAPEPD